MNNKERETALKELNDTFCEEFYNRLGRAGVVFGEQPHSVIWRGGFAYWRVHQEGKGFFASDTKLWRTRPFLVELMVNVDPPLDMQVAARAGLVAWWRWKPGGRLHPKALQPRWTFYLLAMPDEAPAHTEWLWILKQAQEQGLMFRVPAAPVPTKYEEWGEHGELYATIGRTKAALKEWTTWLTEAKRVLRTKSQRSAL